MNKYEVDFLTSCGWFTYDVWADDIFSAAVLMMQIEPTSRITNITFIKVQ